MIANEEEMLRLLDLLQIMQNEQQPRESSRPAPQDVLNASDAVVAPGTSGGEWEALTMLEDFLSSSEYRSWMHPIEGWSRALGGVVEGRNPLEAAADWSGNAPLFGESLVERGAPEWMGIAAEFAVPDPIGAKKVSDLFGLLTLAATIPRSAMKALGKISGLTDNTGAALRMGHGTNVTYDTPRASTHGAHGPGFYVAPEKGPDSKFNAYARGDGGQVRPGYYGIEESALLRSDDVAPFSAERTQRIVEGLSDYPTASQQANVEGFNPRALFDIIYNQVSASEFASTLRKLGYRGMYDANYGVGTLFNPAEDFIGAHDAQAMRKFIVQNQDMLDPDLYRQALKDLDEFVASAPSSGVARQTTTAGQNLTSNQVNTFDSLVDPLIEMNASHLIGTPELARQKDALQNFVFSNLDSLREYSGDVSTLYYRLSKVAPDLIVEFDDASDLMTEFYRLARP